MQIIFLYSTKNGHSEKSSAALSAPFSQSLSQLTTVTNCACALREAVFQQYILVLTGNLVPIINTLDATRHLSGVHTYSPRTPHAIKVARSQVCGNLSGAKKKATISNLHLRLLLLGMAYTAELIFCKTCRSQPTLICREKYHTTINFK